MTDDFDDVDFDADDLGFAPAVSATGADQSSASPERPHARFAHWRSLPRWRRRFAAVVVLFMFLAAMGGLYGLLAAPSSATDVAAAQSQIDTGRQLFSTTCATCHGANLQ